MADRKSKSGGQSQGPKQAAGGGASRSPNPQATNKPRSVATAHRDCSNSSIVFHYANFLSAQMMGNASSKPPASSGQYLTQAPHSPNILAPGLHHPVPEASNICRCPKVIPLDLFRRRRVT